DILQRHGHAVGPAVGLEDDAGQLDVERAARIVLEQQTRLALLLQGALLPDADAAIDGAGGTQDAHHAHHHRRLPELQPAPELHGNPGRRLDRPSRRRLAQLLEQGVALLARLFGNAEPATQHARLGPAGPYPPAPVARNAST